MNKDLRETSRAKFVIIWRYCEYSFNSKRFKSDVSKGDMVCKGVRVNVSH